MGALITRLKRNSDIRVLIGRDNMAQSQLVRLTIFLLFSLVVIVGGAPIDTYESTSEVNDTIFYQLYTRKNPSEGQILYLHDLDALQRSNYNPKLKVKFYAPGLDSNGTRALPTKDEYLARDDCNFIIINWLAIQHPPYYRDGVNNTLEAGAHAGAFIDFLVDNGTPITAIHLMGHSAGCHVVGATGAAVTRGKIPRISGQDPGSLGVFKLNDTSKRLDDTDAVFVDIIHTNSGTDRDESSFFEPIGHVDFYVNGGHHQPGCDSAHCDHCRAVELFAESINSQVGFRALRCDTFEDFQNGLCDGNHSVLMGDPTPSSARGVYQLLTNGEPPYARG